MNNATTRSTTHDKDYAAIEALARESDLPFADVQALYTIERTELELVARIKTFVPVIASRRVRVKLRSNHKHNVSH